MLVMFQKFEIIIKHSEDVLYSGEEMWNAVCECALYIYVCDWGVSGEKQHLLSSGFLCINLLHWVE